MTKNKSSLFADWEDYISIFNSSLEELFTDSFFKNPLFLSPKRDLQKGAADLGQAIKYSLFTGGKRFRPLLTFASCKALDQDFKTALPWAMAVECIHTYSLIHDDLPCMDDDDERRGQPTVHKKFNEATALLAGDALLTEAFGILAKAYENHKNLGQMVQILSQRSGYQGMVSGQANDLFINNLMSKLNTESVQVCSNQNKSADLNVDEDQILFIHLQKTAALINAASMGPFLIFDIDKKISEKVNELSLILGILFQLKDDILDSDIKLENNFVQSLGLDKTQHIYNKYKNDAQKILADLGKNLNTNSYKELIAYNESRNI